MSEQRSIAKDLEEIGWVMQHDPERWSDGEVLHWVAVVYMGARSFRERLRLAWTVLRG